MIRPVSALCALGFLLSAPLVADELTEENLARALEYLKSTDDSKRSGAIAGFRKFGEPATEKYLESLETAVEHHNDALEASATALATRTGPLIDYYKLFGEWKAKRDAAEKLVLTDWKKNKTKHSEMDRGFEATERLWDRLERETERGKTTAELAKLSGSVDALNQIEGEIAWCEGRTAPAYKSLEERLKALDLGERTTAILSGSDMTKRAVAEAARIDEANGDQKWAKSGQKDFAKILNRRRVVLGFQPLRMDELLSKACLGHSKEMAKLGYFSHTSPNEENKTFTKRAKNAGFKGSATGECIYTGGGGSAGAHKAWWYSDGHRLIMYAKGPNTLGIAQSGNLWTLNTGKKKW